MTANTDSAATGTRVNTTAVMDAIGQMHIEDRPVPKPDSHEVLVEVRSVGVCGSDVHFFEHGRIGLDVIQPPHVLGHELSGVIVEHGSEVATPPIGTRVAVEPSRPCGTCPVCRQGRYNLCPDMRYLSAPPTDGAFTRFLAAPASFAYPVPDTLSDDAAALIEPVSVLVHAARRTRIGPGARVLITGAGPIGLLMTQVARAAGAVEVVVSDTIPTRLTLAQQLGATSAVDVSATPIDQTGLTVDFFVECSGNPQALPSGIRCIAPGGTATVVGMSPAEDANIPLAFMQAREITLTPTFRFANAYRTAIDLVATAAVDPEAIITSHFPLHRVQDALRAGQNPHNVKTIVVASD